MKKGINKLLKKFAGGDRFLPLYHEGFDKTSSKIEQMDSSMLRWYDSLKCGVFEFHNQNLHDIVDYFSLTIRNVNTSFLAVEFKIYLMPDKKKELEEIISRDYHEKKSFVNKSVARRNKGGLKDSYSMVYYGDESLKSDRIYEWISCVEWSFFECIKKYIPLVFHNRGIIPPRIEIYYTDIDYHDNNRFFWESIGVVPCQGQFIDERQKMFFEVSLSGRYEKRFGNVRYLYIVKDDGIEIGQLKSVKDQVYYHMDNFAGEYFKCMFLNTMIQTMASTIILDKRKLDAIKLKKNRFKALLKLRYRFEREVDAFERLCRDDIWKQSIETLGNEIYQYSKIITNKAINTWIRTYKIEAESALRGAEHIKGEIEVIRKDFDDKQKILQHLAGYKDTSRTLLINIIMLFIAVVTLFFVIFPEKAGGLANVIRVLVDTWF